MAYLQLLSTRGGNKPSEYDPAASKASNVPVTVLQDLPLNYFWRGRTKWYLELRNWAELEDAESAGIGGISAIKRIEGDWRAEYVS